MDDPYERDLFGDLSNLALADPEVKIEVSADWVFSGRAAVRRDRSCRVSIYHTYHHVWIHPTLGPQHTVGVTNRADPSKSTEAHCLSRFQEGDVLAAVGETTSTDEAVAAIGEWLSGRPLADLYQHFAFVDREKRALEALRAQVIQSFPRLGEVDSRVMNLERPGPAPNCGLWLRASDRECSVWFDFPDGEYRLSFSWDETELVRVATDDADRAGRLMERWLCDRDMPSAMPAQAPEADISPVADYYEAGRGIEGEFLLSWDEVEPIYESKGWPESWGPPYSPDVLRFIRAMRQAGYDRKLRAGTSLSWLVLSRSRRHGLREDQPYVKLSFARRDDEHGLYVITQFDVKTKVHLPEIEFTPEIDRLLRQLADHEID